MLRTLSLRLVAILASAWLVTAPSTAQAQKALVYCPVGLDATGCNAIVAALTADAALFPGGVDAGYDGTSGTVDLATADLPGYAVLVIPSLADGQGVAPYSLLRDATIAGRIGAAFMGRTAVWSGTPDVGSTNRAAKDGLIRNLAGWAKADAAGTHGPGLVVLQDNSDNGSPPYGWLAGLSALTIAPDTTLEVYSNVQVLTTTGRTILTNASGLQIGYTNMASYGLVRTGGTGTSDDATGGRTARVVLVTMAGEPSDPNIATVHTDKEDYSPGEIVIITGSGWQPGETVAMQLHEDPLVHGDRTLSAVADESGHIYNDSFSPEEHDLGVRFVLTAIGQTSGLTAQTTFTDGQPRIVSASPLVLSPNQATSAGFADVDTIVARNQGNGNLTGFVVRIRAGTALAGAPVRDLSVGSLAQNTNATVFWDGKNTSNAFVADGQYTIRALATGQPENDGNNDKVTIVVDNTNPTVAINSPVPNGTTGSALSVTGTAGDQPSVVGAGIDSIRVTIRRASDNAVLATGLASSVTGNFATWSFSYTPSQTGAQNARAVAFDKGGNQTTSNTEAFSVAAPNQAPVANDDAYTTAEDTPLVVAAPGVLTNDTDANGDALTTDDLNSPANGNVVLNANGSFTYTPNANFFGSDQFNYKAKDPSGAKSSAAQVRITITAVNDPPTFNAIANQTHTEGAGAITLAVTGITAGPANENTQTLTFTVTNDKNTLFSTQPSVGAIASGSATLSYTLAAGQTGTANVTVTLKDNGGTANGGNDTFSRNFQITVNPKVATTTTINSDTPDPSIEGNQVTVTVTVAPTSGTGTPTGTVTVSDGVDGCSPAITLAAGTGSCSVALSTIGARTITATYSGDAAFAGSIGTTSHQVNAQNTAPLLSDVPTSATIDELVAYTFTAHATDAEAPPQTLTFSLIGAPSDATIDPSTGAFSWTPTEVQGDGSTYNFKVRVTDSGTPALFAEQSIALTVNEVNSSPTIEAIADKQVRWGHTLSFTATASDDDKPPQGLSFSLGIGAPSTATINQSSGVFSWTPAAGDVGPHSITVKVSDGVATASTSFTATVEKHPTAVTYTGPASAPYLGSALLTAVLTDADANPATPIDGKTITFTIGAASGSGTTMSSGAAGSASATLTFGAAQNAGPYTVASAFAGDGAYEESSDSDPFSITKAHATLTIDPTKLSFVYDGSPKSATVTSTPTGLAGIAVTYDDSPTVPTNAGSYVVVAKLDNINYEADEATATLEISKAPQTITFPAIADRTFGDDPFSAGATVNSTLAIAYSATGNCTVASDGTITITGAGSCKVTAKQPGDNNHFPAADQSQTFAIAKAVPTIAWNDPASIEYGAALSATQLNATVSGVHGASLTGGFVYTPASGHHFGAGSQTLSVTFTPTGADADNYESAEKSVHLTVEKAKLTVKANDKTKVYGEPLPPLDGVFTGFVLDDDETDINTQPTFTTLATPASNVGEYAINGTGGLDDNYTFEFVPGKLTITKATPAFSGLAAVIITYGDASASFSGSIASGTGAYVVHPSGEAVGVTLNGVTQNATVQNDGSFSTSFNTSALGAGGYNVSYAFGGNGNFFAAQNGTSTLTVNKATPTINWSNPAPMVFGQALSGTQLNATVSGVGGSTVTGTFLYSPPAGTVLPVNTQALSVTFTPSGADANNYKSNSKGVQVQVLYNRTGVGFLQPVNLYPQPKSAFKITSTIPVKFQLFLADGVTPYGGANATIQLLKISSDASIPVNEDIITTPADNGVTFRYDAGGRQYIYNMGTKTLTAGMYTINADLHDGGPPVTATVELRAK